MALFAALSMAVAAGGCGGDGGRTQTAQADTTADPDAITLSEAQLAEVTIQATAVTEQPVTTTLQLPARVRPVADQEAYVTSLVDGRIERLRARTGDTVRRGGGLGGGGGAGPVCYTHLSRPSAPSLQVPGRGRCRRRN